MILLGDWAPGVAGCTLLTAGRDACPTGCTLLNLEGPILPATHDLNPAPKAGPNLYSVSLPDTAGTLICSLANNHTMDYGAEGLDATLDTLAQRGHATVGAGNTRDLARRPVMIDDQGHQVAIIACCEAQFGAAETTRAGVAVLGPWVYGAIRGAAARAEAVVVSVHAGAEMSPWPAPLLQDMYRSWIDAGATVIHGHHAHVPQGYEEYHGGLILYGLGNLAVDPRDWQDQANTLWSLGVELDATQRPLKWRLLEFTCRPDGERIAVEPCNAGEHETYLNHCNRALHDRALLEALWQEAAVRSYDGHYRSYLRFPAEQAPETREPDLGLVAALRRRWQVGARGPARTAGPSRQDYLLWYHLFGCLTHNDLIATALGVLSGELSDLRCEEASTLVDELMAWTIPFAETANTPSPAGAG